MWRCACLRRALAACLTRSHLAVPPPPLQQQQHQQPSVCGLLWQRRWCGGSTLNESASSGLTASSTSAPAWQRIVECIQVALEEPTDVEHWRCLCRLWRLHFPQEKADSLSAALEEELLSNHSERDECTDDTVAEERVPRDLHSLPVFVQALCAAVQLGEAQLRFLPAAAAAAPAACRDDGGDDDERLLFASVIAELRVVALFLAQERLTHTLHATHHRVEVGGDAHSEAYKSAIVPDNAPLPSRAGEQVRHLGVRLSPEELQQAIVLADTGTALLALRPPVILLPALYRLLLPALGACEQLDSCRLGALATALARSADFDDPNRGDPTATGISAVTASPSAGVDTDGTGEVLRPAMTSYTVLSHLHAVARTLEVRMRVVIESAEVKLHRRASTQEAKLRLLSLKERKALERQEREAAGGEDATKRILLEDVVVVCSALAARHYADGRFWATVTEYTAAVVSTAGVEAPNSLQDVRDILFALDYVRQPVHFERLMSLLVEFQLLQGPIAPPSSTQKAMKAVKGRTAASFD